MTHDISPEERSRIALDYELVMDLLAKRHGITEADLRETVEWVRRHREWVEAMKRGSTLSLIGFLGMALLIALWEGVKHMVGRTP